MNMQSLAHLTHEITRSISPENMTGEKEKGGLCPFPFPFPALPDRDAREVI